MKRIACNPMVLRQTPGSKFSHFEPAAADADRWQVLVSIVAKRLAERQPLNPEGTVAKLVLALDGLPGSFFSAVVAVDEKTAFATTYAPRQGAVPGEAPFIQTVAVGGRKKPARRAEVILYHVSALTEAERTYLPAGATEPVVVDAEWQIVSLNCQSTDEPEPPTPQAMARNMAAKLGLPEGVGGTPRSYTAEEFRLSILFWSQRTMCAGS